MNILHVSLGVPPLRTGGMTRYCVELAQEQARQGDNVSLLFPGRFLPGKTRIRKGSWEGLATYEVVNPLPVALTYGIDDPARFITRCDNPIAYKKMLESIHPDTVHIHCYQGIHREFFELVKSSGIKMLFTTHDYYPMCPRCTFITPEGDECDATPSADKCARCNYRKGMSFRKSVIMQSRIYALLKDSHIARTFGGIVKKNLQLGGYNEAGFRQLPTASYVQAYGELLSYNREIFSLFDTVLANSSLAEGIFKEHYPGLSCTLIPITHSGLSRSEPRAKKFSRDTPLGTAYFGGSKKYKGINVIAEAMNILDKQNINIELALYGDDYAQIAPIVNSHVVGRVNPDSIPEEIKKYDLVIVPSSYRETFGFVVLEALCEGTPVICSDVVGARDLVEKGCVFKAGDSTSLANAIIRLIDKGFICTRIPQDYPLSIADQVREVKRLYRDITQGYRGTR